MSRWQPDAQRRLQHAAMTLFGERGFDDVTVAEIAERAGLTKRTFFRYFADKREVLFSGGEELERLFVDAVLDAPPTASPLDAVAAAFGGVGKMFAPRREFAAARSRIVEANPELQERELIKLARLGSAVAGALRARGCDTSAATLAAETGITVFRLAFNEWVRDPSAPPLDEVMCQSLNELRAIVAD